MKGIWIITLMLIIKKQIIQTTMTKLLSNLALERIISINKVTIRLEKYAKR